VLRDLHVNNLAVLEEASVQFGPGLNVLSGETGAGKSIVVDSLALLAGARASSELIRSGEPKLVVTGVFQPAGEQWRRVLAAAGAASDSRELVVRREISRGGRNRVFVDDQPVTLGLLSQLAPYLLRIHTQQEELGLVSPELQRTWLDRSSGPQAFDLCRQTAQLHHEYTELAERLESIAGDARLRRERLDLLSFQCGEIDAAKLSPQEDESLRRERQVLQHSEAIAAALGGSYGMLFDEEGAASEKIAMAVRRLEEISDWEPEAEAWRQQLQELGVALEEVARVMQQRLDSVEADPERLNEIEERLALIDRLCRKYGESTAEILELRTRIGEELDQLRVDSEQQVELQSKVDEALQTYRRAALDLSGYRSQWAEDLAERVHAELKDLALPKARFSVDLGRRRRSDSRLLMEGEPVEFSAQGIDQVSFQLAANPGEGAQPLARCASGGELSRIYLAVQLAVRADGGAESPTLVFDEVDSGIGGAQAAALGKKLQRLADGGQILTVTHLPQVASHADHHFRVSKRVSGGRTRTRVDRLGREEQIVEVARMLGGKKVTPLSRSHAEEMIAAAERGSR
jgi:DNA repair protein RecN (Recombination protein N)